MIICEIVKKTTVPIRSQRDNPNYWDDKTTLKYQQNSVDIREQKIHFTPTLDTEKTSLALCTWKRSIYNKNTFKQTHLNGSLQFFLSKISWNINWLWFNEKEFTSSFTKLT